MKRGVRIELSVTKMYPFCTPAWHLQNSVKLACRRDTKILRERNGNRKIMEAGLECGAAAYGVSVEETLLRICLLPDVSLETKFELARIARDRGMPGVVLVFSSPDRR